MTVTCLEYADRARQIWLREMGLPLREPSSYKKRKGGKIKEKKEEPFKIITHLLTSLGKSGKTGETCASFDISLTNK